MATTISFDDLVEALMWVSSPPEADAEAFISRATGKTYVRAIDGPIDEDFPPDVDDDTKYVAVPRRNELDLGRVLALRFIDEMAPHLEAEVRHAFGRQGAYRYLRALLDRNGLLDRWHEYENAATKRALESWAQEQGFQVAGGRRDT